RGPAARGPRGPRARRRRDGDGEARAGDRPPRRARERGRPGGGRDDAGGCRAVQAGTRARVARGGEGAGRGDAAALGERAPPEEDALTRTGGEATPPRSRVRGSTSRGRAPGCARGPDPRSAGTPPVP